jgi:Mn2+/Fe2+ NRAMP family transporter
VTNVTNVSVDLELYSEPPSTLQRMSWTNLIRTFGLGAIIASVTIGSGELVWASRGGAVFGYTMLWCFLYGGLFKAIQVYTGMRYLTLTGQHPMMAWRSIPGPGLWFLWLIIVPMIPIMVIALSTISETVGTFIHQLSGIDTATYSRGIWDPEEFWHNLWGALALIVCFAIARRSNYTILERISMLVLFAMLVCVGLSALATAPHVGEIIRGMLVPTMSEYEPWVLDDPRYSETFRDWSPWLEVGLYVWAVGGGTQDYAGYIGLVREKRWGLAGSTIDRRDHLLAATQGDSPQAREQVRRARMWLRAPLWDTTISFSLVVLATLLFAVLGAQLLHPKHIIPDGADLLTVQETFLTHLHPLLSMLYRVAVFLALGGTLYGIFEIYPRTMTESATAIYPPMQHHSQTAWTTAFQYGLLITSLAMIWLPAGLVGDIVTRLGFATVIGGATSTSFWLLAMLWTESRFVPAPLRMHKALQTLVWIAAAIMMVLGIQSFIAFFS